MGEQVNAIAYSRVDKKNRIPFPRLASAQLVALCFFMGEDFCIVPSASAYDLTETQRGSPYRHTGEELSPGNLTLN
jgi:hypothetical protein